MPVHSHICNLFIGATIPAIPASAIVILFPDIYNSIEQPKPVIDTIGIKDKLAIRAPGNTLFEYRTDTIIER